MTETTFLTIPRSSDYDPIVVTDDGLEQGGVLVPWAEVFDKNGDHVVGGLTIGERYANAYGTTEVAGQEIYLPNPEREVTYQNMAGLQWAINYINEHRNEWFKKRELPEPEPVFFENWDEVRNWFISQESSFAGNEENWKYIPGAMDREGLRSETITDPWGENQEYIPGQQSPSITQQDYDFVLDVLETHVGNVATHLAQNEYNENESDPENAEYWSYILKTDEYEIGAPRFTGTFDASPASAFSKKFDILDPYGARNAFGLDNAWGVPSWHVTPSGVGEFVFENIVLLSVTSVGPANTVIQGGIRALSAMARGGYSVVRAGVTGSATAARVIAQGGADAVHVARMAKAFVNAGGDAGVTGGSSLRTFFAALGDDPAASIVAQTLGATGNFTATQVAVLNRVSGYVDEAARAILKSKNAFDDIVLKLDDALSGPIQFGGRLTDEASALAIGQQAARDQSRALLQSMTVKQIDEILIANGYTRASINASRANKDTLITNILDSNLDDIFIRSHVGEKLPQTAMEGVSTVPVARASEFPGGAYRGGVTVDDYAAQTVVGETSAAWNQGQVIDEVVGEVLPGIQTRVQLSATEPSMQAFSLVDDTLLGGPGRLTGATGHVSGRAAYPIRTADEAAAFADDAASGVAPAIDDAAAARGVGATDDLANRQWEFSEGYRGAAAGAKYPASTHTVHLTGNATATQAAAAQSIWGAIRNSKIGRFVWPTRDQRFWWQRRLISIGAGVGGALTIASPFWGGDGEEEITTGDGQGDDDEKRGPLTSTAITHSDGAMLDTLGTADATIRLLGWINDNPVVDSYGAGRVFDSLSAQPGEGIPTAADVGWEYRSLNEANTRDAWTTKWTSVDQNWDLISSNEELMNEIRGLLRERGVEFSDNESIKQILLDDMEAAKATWLDDSEGAEGSEGPEPEREQQALIAMAVDNWTNERIRTQGSNVIAILGADNTVTDYLATGYMHPIDEDLIDEARRTNVFSIFKNLGPQNAAQQVLDMNADRELWQTLIDTLQMLGYLKVIRDLDTGKMRAITAQELRDIYNGHNNPDYTGQHENTIGSQIVDEWMGVQFEFLSAEMAVLENRVSENMTPEEIEEIYLEINRSDVLSELILARNDQARSGLQGRMNTDEQQFVSSLTTAVENSLLEAGWNPDSSTFSADLEALVMQSINSSQRFVSDDYAGTHQEQQLANNLLTSFYSENEWDVLATDLDEANIYSKQRELAWGNLDPVLAQTITWADLGMLTPDMEESLRQSDMAAVGMMIDDDYIRNRDKQLFVGILNKVRTNADGTLAPITRDNVEIALNTFAHRTGSSSHWIDVDLQDLVNDEWVNSNGFSTYRQDPLMTTSTQEVSEDLLEDKPDLVSGDVFSAINTINSLTTNRYNTSVRGSIFQNR